MITDMKPRSQSVSGQEECEEQVASAEGGPGRDPGSGLSRNNARLLSPPSTKRFILMDDPSRQYTVVQADLPAANGIIHIIDQPILRTPSDGPPRDEQVGPETSDSLGGGEKSRSVT